MFRVSCSLCITAALSPGLAHVYVHVPMPHVPHVPAALIDVLVALGLALDIRYPISAFLASGLELLVLPVTRYPLPPWLVAAYPVVSAYLCLSVCRWY